MDGFVITHIADIDGIASAALLMKRYGIGVENVIFADHNIENLGEAERQLKRVFRRGGTLYITDLNPGGPEFEIFSRIVKYVKENDGKVFWFDHHPWEEGAMEKLGRQCEVAVGGENHRFCAAEITAKEIGMDDRFTRKLLEMVHCSDFALTPKNAKMKEIIGDYVLSITYFNSIGPEVRLRRIREIAVAVSRGVMVPDFVRKASREFTQINDRKLAEMERTIINGGLVSVGFSSFVSTNNACARIKEKTNSDIGVYVNVDIKKAHLRSDESDCSKLAQQFGGGGHPHASGFEIEKNYDLKTNSGRQKLAQEIIQRALELYK